MEEMTSLRNMAVVDKSYASISAVERALQILEILSEHQEGLTGSDLASRLGLHRATAFRLLSSLMGAGFVAQHEPGPHYRLTLKLVSLASGFLASLGPVELAIPILRQLSDRTGELVQLAMVDGDEMIRVAKAEGRERLRVAAPTGSGVTLHVSSLGKAWLSTLPTERAAAILCERGLPARTPNTITTLEGMLADLEQTRVKGYAICFEEGGLGMCSVGAPIILPCGGDRVAVGAVNVAAPSMRASRERLVEWAPLVVATATELAQIWSLG